MPTLRESKRIVIAGASSLLGGELKSLLEESLLADWDFRLLDEESVSGTLTEAGGGAAVIQSVEEDSFEKARLIFFAGTAGFTRANVELARRSGGTIIDLSGGASGSEVRLWNPGAGVAPEKGIHYAVLSAPAAVTVALLDALNRVGLSRLGILFFRPVSEAGKPGIDELEGQTSQLLSLQAVGQSVFGTQVAFSLADRYGKDSGESLTWVRERIRREVAPLVGKRGVIPSIQVIHAPVFYGYAFAALAETASDVSLQKIAEVCKEVGFQLWKKEEGPLGNLSVGDDAMRLALPEGKSAGGGQWWCWGAVDNIKQPAKNAVRLAEKLVE